MQKIRRLLVDVSSVIWMSMLAGKDQEYGKEVDLEGKRVWVNGWQFGYENAVSHITTVMREYGFQPHNLIFVVEGKMSKARRTALYKDYKGTRSTRPPEAYEEFNRCKEEVTRAFRNVGANTVSQDGVEADDVIAYLAQHLDGDRFVLTNDGDLAALISPDVSLIRKGALVTENPYGPFPTRLITVYKALVGDSSDAIKGAPGFGEKAFLDLLVWAGDAGLAAMEGMILRKQLHELKDDIAEFKPMKKIVEGADSVYTSYAVAKLHPEWCNTMRQPLVWTPGMVRGRDVVLDERLRPYAQQVRLITCENYAAAMQFLEQQVGKSPVVPLDIETSTPDESDEWLASGDREDKVDMLGSKLTGMSITFGPNMQYTYYISVDHAETKNVTSDQARAMVERIPRELFTVAHNNYFELTVLFQEWGEAWKDNGYHGYLPNCVDTRIMSRYTDENLSAGLKSISSHYLGYQQVTYEEVTTKRGLKGTLDRGRITKLDEIPLTHLVEKQVGKIGDENYQTVMVEEIVTDDEGAPVIKEVWETRRYKMNELTAEEVVAYGADDTICTAAAYVHFRTVMEIEKTWDVYLQVEQYPAYVLAHGYVKGTKFNLETMNRMAKEDQAKWDEHWKVLRQFLIDIGWDGTVCPEFTELTPAAVKEAVLIILGDELKTQVRTVSKLAKLVEVMEHSDAPLLARYIAEGDIAQINDWMKSRFKGEPVLDTDSPKQMKKFLYETLGLPVRIVGSTTPLERQNKKELAAAVTRYKRIWAGSQTEPALTDSEKELLKQKAKTNEIAISFALLLDGDNPHIGVLKHIQAMKKIETRQKLYYRPYLNLRHWKDNMIHAGVSQSAQVTLRNTAADPNLTQLPKKGEGVKFRECFEAHHKGAVVVSIDFGGQELRQAAGQSMDPNMLACFVGDNLKDMHSLTAAGAMQKKWGAKVVEQCFAKYGSDLWYLDGEVTKYVAEAEYKLFQRLRKADKDDEVDGKVVPKMADDLRKNAKNVNFGAQYDAQAPKLAETLIIPVADAEAFLQAKYAMFPRFEAWKEEVKAEAQNKGYVTTCMGARRHLREALLSEEWGVADKALRQGPNFKIQGSSAEQTKLAMGRLWKSGILFTLDMFFFAPIHDELVWSVARQDAVESIRVTHDCMTQPYGNLPVPFIGSISLGPNFGKQIECGDDFDEAAINEALVKVFEEKVAA